MCLLLLFLQTCARGAARRPPFRRSGPSNTTPQPSSTVPKTTPSTDDLFGDLPSPPPSKQAPPTADILPAAKHKPDLFGNDNLFNDLA